MSSSSSVDGVRLDLSVVVGHATLPIWQLLRMGRGAVILLDAKADQPCRVYVGDQLVARGEPLDLAGNIGIHLTEMTEPA